MTRKSVATAVRSIKYTSNLFFAIILVFIVVLGSMLFRQNIKNQLNAWSLLPRQESLTELYFKNPNSLPSVYSASEPQTVSFEVHNLENSTTNYQYTITQVGDYSTTLSSGSFTLLQGSKKEVNSIFEPVDTGAHARIIITLTNIHESISYLVARRP